MCLNFLELEPAPIYCRNIQKRIRHGLLWILVHLVVGKIDDVFHISVTYQQTFCRDKLIQSVSANIRDYLLNATKCLNRALHYRVIIMNLLSVSHIFLNCARTFKDVKKYLNNIMNIRILNPIKGQCLVNVYVLIISVICHLNVKDI